MNFTSQELEELNLLLKNINLKLPDFRRKVSNSGRNYIWLQRNICKKNPNIDSRLKELLKI